MNVIVFLVESIGQRMASFEKILSFGQGKLESSLHAAILFILQPTAAVQG